jgi:acyl-CoA hydrolase
MSSSRSQKTPAQSEVVMTELVFPNDTNPMGIVQGGKIIQLMDIACAICAQIHSEKIAVTASIDNVSFKHSAKLGDILTIKAKITRSFNSSMEIFAQVSAKHLPEMKPRLTSEAFFTFVALDQHAKPTAVISVLPESAEEKLLYESAFARKTKRTNK